VLDFVNPYFKQWLARTEPAGEDNVLKALMAESHHKLLQSIRENGVLPRDEINDSGIFKTAHEIEPSAHVKMQAAWQEHTDNAVSKTINLPHEATESAVEDAYQQAWDSGCLGITVFRDGSKGAQVLNVGVAQSDEQKAAGEALASPTVHIENGERSEYGMWVNGSGSHYGEPIELGKDGKMRKRDDVVHGYTRNIPGPEGNIKVTLNSDSAGLLEVFINVGHAGSDVAAMAEGIGRMISLNLRMEGAVPNTERVRDIAEQLKGIGGSRSVGFGANQVRSLPDAVAQALQLHASEAGKLVLDFKPVFNHGSIENERKLAPVAGGSNGNLCPDCRNTTMIFQEGCKKCVGCGYSEC